MWQPPMMADGMSYYPNSNWRQRGNARSYRRFRGNRFHWNHQNRQNCHQPFTGQRNEEQNYFGRMDTCGIPNRYQHENTGDYCDNTFMNSPAPHFHPITRGGGFQRIQRMFGTPHPWNQPNDITFMDPKEVPRRWQGRCQTPGPSNLGRPRIERMCRTPTPWNRQDDAIFQDVNEKFPPDLEIPPPTYKKRIQLDWRELEIPPPKYERRIAMDRSEEEMPQRMHIDRSEREIPPPKYEKRIQIDPKELDIPSPPSNERRCQNNQLKEKELNKTVLLPNDKMRAQLEQEISTISASPEKRNLIGLNERKKPKTVASTSVKRNLIGLNERKTPKTVASTSDKEMLKGSSKQENTKALTPMSDKRNFIHPSGQGNITTSDKKIQPEHGEQITKTLDLKSDCGKQRSNLIWNFSPNAPPDSLEEGSDLELLQPGTSNITVIDAIKKNDNEINNEVGKQADINPKLEAMNQRVQPYYSITPVGLDGISERLVYYCKHCNMICLDKETGNMHVKTLYHNSKIDYKASSCD